MDKSKRYFLPALMGSVLLFSMACQVFSQAAPLTPPPPAPVTNSAVTPFVEPSATETKTVPQSQITPPADVYLPAFAPYQPISVKLPSGAFNGYTLPVDLAQVKDYGIPFSDAQRSTLAKNGFVVFPPKPGDYREFYQVYETTRYSAQVPNFVTTDAVFHIYHLTFDKMLRDLERDYFLSTLSTLTHAMLVANQNQLDQVTGTSLEEPVKRNLAFFGVAARLLNLQDPTPDAVKDLVDAEVKLIEEHAGPAISPIWDRPDLDESKKLIEDYSQYIPRGHYTRSEELKRYFKSMMWFGRLTFRLRDSFETQRALLLTEALRTAQTDNKTPLSTLWESIYEPTVFIVGKTDDLSYHEYGVLSDSVFGVNPPLSVFADNTRLTQFLQAAKDLPEPKINSMWVWIHEDVKEATKGFRFMGQRFTLDEYVYGQLMWRKVGTESDPRMFPKALDFFASQGSGEAAVILKEFNENHYANYDTQMAKVQQEITSLQLDSWTQNLYWSWLYAFQPVFMPKDERFPAFMRTQAWQRKDLNTVLGSYAELKHDTILYAKQVMAEMGGGPGEEPPKGYVEPNPEAFGRLVSLAQMTYEGLSQRNILSETTKGNLNNLIDLLTFLKTSSEKELAGEALSADDYNRIQYIGGFLESLTLAAADRDTQDGSFRDLSDQKAALIADIATGALPSGGLGALEEAIGQPTEIYVILPDSPWRIARGAVFTYYEFIVPVDQRMTDEAWQAQVESGSNPPLPDWTKLFIIP